MEKNFEMLYNLIRKKYEEERKWKKKKLTKY